MLQETRPRSRAFLQLFGLALSLTLVAVDCHGSDASDKKRTDKERISRKRKDSERTDQTVAEVLARQKKKGHELQVYLRDARRVYVNGKQISLKSLSTIVSKSRVRKALISAESHVSAQRIAVVKKAIRKGRLKKIKVQMRKPAKDRLAKQTGRRERREPSRQLAIREILSRQKKKGDVLQVYVKNATRTYVNGKQVSLETLTLVVRESRTRRAVLRAEEFVSAKRVKEVRDAIRKGGLKSVSVSPVRQTDKQR